MKQFRAYFGILILLFSCQEKTNSLLEGEGDGNVWVSDDIQIDAGIILSFKHGELSRFPDTLFQRHILARLESDTLFLSLRTLPGYVAGRVECKIIHDTMYIHARKSSCTYTNEYTALNSMLEINKWPVQVNDTILITMNALLICDRETAVEDDTLLVFGSSKVIVHPGFYTYPDIRYDFDTTHHFTKTEFLKRRGVH